MTEPLARPSLLSIPGVGDHARRLRAGYLELHGVLYDRITGLSVYQAHRDELKRRASGLRLGILTLEFPNFGTLEATHGWEVGDRILASVASLLGSLKGTELPDSALIAIEGTGGSGFLIFFEEGRGPGGPTLAELAEIAERIGARIRERKDLASWLRSGLLDFNLGHAIVSGSSIARFERRIAHAISEARAMTFRATDRQQQERVAELRSILRGGTLTTHYQPIVDMEIGAIMGYEALTRGPANTRLEVPEALFACSDSAQLSGELDVLCRTQAVRNARGVGSSVKLFVNALPEALRSPGSTCDRLEGLLAEIDLEPRNLVLEITERCAIDDLEEFCGELSAIRRQGFLIAIDDVGTGYSSLHSITEIQPEFLKIDISLIKNVHQSLIKQHLVQSLMQVGARIGAQVIAEGIESEEECRTVCALGVRYGQGFYFAHPAPPFPELKHRGPGLA
ncbi:MAG: bifunctional diguanylate cyclase/phosphodiesterase [Acidobacteria bacterium]|nr:bifunctional diguanylate cyclase/phosphodiesterase [Acidobacteriota bacterium]